MLSPTAALYGNIQKLKVNSARQTVVPFPKALRVEKEDTFDKKRKVMTTSGLLRLTHNTPRWKWEHPKKKIKSEFRERIGCISS